MNCNIFFKGIARSVVLLVLISGLTSYNLISSTHLIKNARPKIEKGIKLIKDETLISVNNKNIKMKTRGKTGFDLFLLIYCL